jgi:hypothetical protein
MIKYIATFQEVCAFGIIVIAAYWTLYGVGILLDCTERTVLTLWARRSKVKEIPCVAPDNMRDREQ